MDGPRVRVMIKLLRQHAEEIEAMAIGEVTLAYGPRKVAARVTRLLPSVPVESGEGATIAT